jgi:hypothetical protein
MYVFNLRLNGGNTMKKLLLLGALLTMGTAVFASVEDKHNINLGIGYATVDDYKESAVLSYDYLPFVKNDTRYGVTLGATYNKLDSSTKGLYDSDDMDVKTVFLGVTGKHYYNDNLYLKGTLGYNYGSSEVDFKAGSQKVGEIKTDMTGFYSNFEVGYEFENGLSIGTYAGATQYDAYTKNDITGEKKSDSDKWMSVYGVKIGYAF